ncbi:NADH:flavin oxidoreductase/NADH oxidase [Paenibacillus glufosinatiresistens]|uniref:NADH:flavin oxidoreductase/NADH oxidase n=1 Tax=Paenibacillus glufosinatiresistens TaxID=3070657 RepID=UPI00286DF4C0|nr:NADH:flavin oxidoreductase/NADH oxidase [Paenibacillus sp. YX.27]
MAQLFTPYEIKNLKLKNRVVMPPMCQYSVVAEDGIPNDWHYVHYVSRAVGGTGLLIAEMSGIEPDGRITNQDTGIWSDDQIPAWRRITEAVHSYGAKIGIQLGHAGRKAQDAEPPVAPSAIAFDGKSKVPAELSTEDAERLVAAYAAAARRAVEAGFDTVEIHGAHGYLIHQFLSPLSNRREDRYGQDRLLFGEETVRAVKAVLPEDMPLLMRVSAREYVDGGYGTDYAVEFCSRYHAAGVDVFHISSGGEGPIGAGGLPTSGPGYQVGLAEAVRQGAGVPVIAVGRLEDPKEAEAALAEGRADLIAVGRAMLSDPYWALHAQEALGGVCDIPEAYVRGVWKKA